MNTKSIAAHVVTYAGGVLAILNIVATSASSVSLPAPTQAAITIAVGVLTVIVEVAKQVAASQGTTVLRLALRLVGAK